jgi:hypothetical protein
MAMLICSLIAIFLSVNLTFTFKSYRKMLKDNGLAWTTESTVFAGMTVVPFALMLISSFALPVICPPLSIFGNLASAWLAIVATFAIGATTSMNKRG